MLYVYLENRDAIDFGMGPPEGLIRPARTTVRMCDLALMIMIAKKQLALIVAKSIFEKIAAVDVHCC